MSLRMKIFGTALLLSGAMCACSQEAIVPTHFAQINLEPNRYDELIDKLDAVMKVDGLSRFSAAPGLKELRGREVLYVEYRRNQSDKLAFITATDVVKAGIIEMRVYSTLLTEDQKRNEAMSRLDGVLAQFGSALKAR